MSVTALWRDRALSGTLPAVDARQSRTDAPERTQTRNKRIPVKALECLTCRARYSRDDVLSGLYQISTKVCGECYARMQAAPHSVSCFGKPTTVMPDGSRLPGYDADAVECRELCPDAALCASVADPASYNLRR